MADSRPGLAVTIGFFDGVHRGHQRLIERVRAVAAAAGLRPAALTFDLHSLEVLHGHAPLQTILSTAEKAALLESYGLAVTVLHFTPEFAAQTGAEFVARVLVEQLGARAVVVGRDFRFGRGRACGAADLEALAAAHGVAVTVVDLVDEAGHKIGSRAIRERLAAGEVSSAADLLGRPYSLTGEVVEGRRLGRTIGFPTANLAVDPRKIVPACGVYAVWARLADRRYPAALNLGIRPTVDAGAGAVSIEAHLLDFDGDLYGRTLTVEFVARLRDEQRFDGLPALQRQIAADVTAARAVLGA